MEMIHKLFLQELNAVLIKYGATLTLQDSNPIAYMPEKEIIVEFDWKEDQGIIKDIVLGCYHDGED